MIIHTAKIGEGIFDIAEEYGISPYRLAATNGLDVYSRLYEGEKILVSIPTKTYSVRKGDSIDGISRRFGEKKDRILEINPESGGKQRLYRGQCLALKCDEPTYGAIATNGYLYPGYSKSRLISCMPYLSVLTIAFIKAICGKIFFVMDEGEVAEICACYKKPLIARVYIEEMPTGSEIYSLARGIAIAAKSKGCFGVTLAAPRAKHKKEDYAILTTETKKQLTECGLMLYTETDLDKDGQTENDSDGKILFYDKLDKKEIPTFEDGESALLRAYASKDSAPRTFLDLSPYAFCKGRYTEKQKARGALLSRKTRISYMDDGRLVIGELAHGGEIIMETLLGVKSRLEMIYEHGYLGAAIDVMRTPTQELMLLSSMFSVLKFPWANGEK